MISVGIIGGSGYTGKKLIDYLHLHPFVEEISLYSYTTAGKSLYQIFPELAGVCEDKTFISIADLNFDQDVYFIALPHGEALKVVPQLLNAGKVVIDLGGDFRLDDAAQYPKWYHFDHQFPDLLKNKIYGLADWFKSYDDSINLIANPGCYPTATALSLLPIAKHFSGEILSTSTVAYSGTSGAGKSANADLLLSEMDGNVRAYNVHHHRHEPEIIQTLQTENFNSPFSFTTHLLPVAVGIYATTSVHLKSEISAENIKSAFQTAYENAPFVRLREIPPNLKWVVGSNFCDIHISVSGKSVIITTAIDNLIKGASGQAVQNMNKKFGWDETLGILKENKLQKQTL